MSSYASNGTIRVSVVDRSTRTGLFAADGSVYVVEAPGGTFVGSSHPCGALYVTAVAAGTFVGAYASDGSLNVIEASSSPEGAMPVTVVSGSFGGGGGVETIGLLWFLQTWRNEVT